MNHIFHTLFLLAVPALLITAARADEAAQMARGKLLFTSAATPPCAICHTLKDANAEGTVGPVFDELQPDAARITRALRDGVGNMPSFKGSLSEADISALALYVSRASRGK